MKRQDNLALSQVMFCQQSSSLFPWWNQGSLLVEIIVARSKPDQGCMISCYLQLPYRPGVKRKFFLVDEKHKSKVNAVGMRYLTNVCGKTRMGTVNNKWVPKEYGLKGNPTGFNMWGSCLVVVLCVVLYTVSALENGLVRTPPMGWLSWERFRCNTDCKNDPDNCISHPIRLQRIRSSTLPESVPTAASPVNLVPPFHSTKDQPLPTNRPFQLNSGLPDSNALSNTPSATSRRERCPSRIHKPRSSTPLSALEEIMWYSRLLGLRASYSPALAPHVPSFKVVHSRPSCYTSIVLSLHRQICREGERGINVGPLSGLQRENKPSVATNFFPEEPRKSKRPPLNPSSHIRNEAIKSKLNQVCTNKGTKNGRVQLDSGEILAPGTSLYWIRENTGLNTAEIKAHRDQLKAKDVQVQNRGVATYLYPPPPSIFLNPPLNNPSHNCGTRAAETDDPSTKTDASKHPVAPVGESQQAHSRSAPFGESLPTQHTTRWKSRICLSLRQQQNLAGRRKERRISYSLEEIMAILQIIARGTNEKPAIRSWASGLLNSLNSGNVLPDPAVERHPGKSADKLFRTMADLVVSEGYAAVGYEYINIDDCWLEKERNFRGELQPDKQRFPYGLRDLSNFEGQPTQHMPHVARPAAPHSHGLERILLRIDGV
uniref:(California timema) hypothetical protein n=1 Tax=Timema californicum TaxID=61474 RepID=A0A7R9P902_TIMCA|nr:unnamed protein product [Timema californicum]